MSNPAQLSLTGSRTIGQVTLDANRTAGEGGPADPRLILQLQITLHAPPEGAIWALTELVCSLHLSSPAFEGNQIGQATILNRMYGFPWRVGPGAPTDILFQVRLPLTQAIIAQLEQRRRQHTEHAFSVYMHLQPTLAWLEQTGNLRPDTFGEHPFKNQHLGPFSRLAYFWYAQVGDLLVEVPASVWVQQVLPGFGLDRQRLVEITLPEAGLFPAEIIGYFDTAKRHLDLGNYRQSMAACRDVRNAIELHLGATRARPVSDVIADRLGLAADAPQRSILRVAWEALREATNEAHHIPGGPRLIGSDARLCLHLTAIVLEYIGQLR